MFRWNTGFNLVGGLFCVAVGGGLLAFFWHITEGYSLPSSGRGGGEVLGVVALVVGLRMLWRAFLKIRNPS